MEKKKTNIIFLGLVVILAFFAGFLVNQSNVKRLADVNGRLEQVVQQQDVQIKTLAEQLQVGQKGLDTVRNELTSSKSELDRVIKELDSVNNKLKTLTIPPTTVSE